LAIRLNSLLATAVRKEISQPLVLVTHQVNITSFTGVYPGSGEIVIVERQRSGEFSVVGAITTVALD
jgi:hypothetical protein